MVILLFWYLWEVKSLSFMECSFDFGFSLCIVFGGFNSYTVHFHLDSDPVFIFTAHPRGLVQELL